MLFYEDPCLSRYTSLSIDGYKKNLISMTLPCNEKLLIIDEKLVHPTMDRNCAWIEHATYLFLYASHKG